MFTLVNTNSFQICDTRMKQYLYSFILNVSCFDKFNS